MKSSLLVPALALSLCASISETKAQTVNCVSGASISANSFCIFLQWNGNGPSSFTGISLVYNGSTYTFNGGSGTSASPASFKSGGGGGSCNANQTTLTSLAGQNIQFVTGSGTTTCLVAPTPNPLPIVLSSFTAKASGSSVQINWTTEMEKNVNYFAVQRSTDGINWNNIATNKPAAASSNLTQNYTYTDNLSAEVSGQVYYRLETVDYGGATSFSDVSIVRIAAGGQTNTKVYPTVTNGKINISTSATDATIMLTDLMGAKVSVAPMSNGQMDIQQLPAGMYILNVLSKQGNESFKIVKQ